MTTVSFLGLGAMGLPMAKRLINAGYSLNIMQHSRPEPVEELRSMGAAVSGNLPELLAASDVIVSILPSDVELRAIFLDDSITSNIRNGSTLLEMSSAMPETIQEIAVNLASRGVSCIDAPVSGGVKGAAEGTLTIMCGADAADYSANLPLLKVFGSKIYLLGKPGAGKAMKAVNQLLVAAHNVLTAEALALAGRLELDLEVAYDVLCSSSGMSRILTNKYLKMLKHDFSTNFSARLMHKDLKIALSAAKTDNLELPVASAALKSYASLPEEFINEDISAIFRLYDV